MADIHLSITNMEGNPVEVTVPTDMPLRRLKARLIAQWGLPALNQEGHPITYEFRNARTGQAVEEGPGVSTVVGDGGSLTLFSLVSTKDETVQSKSPPISHLQSKARDTLKEEKATPSSRLAIPSPGIPLPPSEAGHEQKLDGYFRELEKKIIRLKRVARELDSFPSTEFQHERDALRSLLKHPSKAEDAERGMERLKEAISRKRA